MRNEHLISSCIWQTEFDQQEQAQRLQDFISEWSNSVLLQEVEEFFTQACPANEVWRIDSLQLDLGEITYADLREELPRRVRASLQQELARLHTHQQVAICRHHFSNSETTMQTQGQASDALHNQAMPASAELSDFMAWYLRTGTTPWWYTGQLSVAQMIAQQLVEQTDMSRASLQKLGQHEYVRQRIVWQLGEPIVRSVIQVLEPEHADFICQYADHVFAMQAQRHLVQAKRSEFRQHTWLHILQYLLLDRGTLFNTVSFVRANLQQMAQRYQITYQNLLQLVVAALHIVQADSVARPLFLQALAVLQRDDAQLPAVARVSHNAQAEDDWAHLQAMLRGAQKSRRVSYTQAIQASQTQTSTQTSQATKTLTLVDLFTNLAQQDAVRMAALLRSEGRAMRVRQGLLRHFARSQLITVLEVLEPQEHSFILAHIQHSQSQLQSKVTEEKLVWEVVLAYLLYEAGSHFNRRQMVQITLQQVCARSGIVQADFLDVLIASLSAEDRHSVALLQIFHALKSKLPEQPAQAQQAAHLTLTDNADPGLTQYLCGGKPAATESQAALTALWNQIICQAGRATKDEHNELGQTENAAENLVAAVQQALAQGVSDARLSQRLLKLVRASDFSLLFDLIQENAAPFCNALLRDMLALHAHRSVLAGMDLAWQLPAMIVQALLRCGQIRQGARCAFALSNFWPCFTTLLQQRRVSIARLLQYLHDRLSAASTQDTALMPWRQGLMPMLVKAIADTKIVTVAALDAKPALPPAQALMTWTQAALFDALQQNLAMPAGASRDIRAETIARLWQELMRRDSKAIRAWLLRQKHSDELLQQLGQWQQYIPALTQWLDGLAPKHFNESEILAGWLRLWLASACWHGAEQDLRAQLQVAYWAQCLATTAAQVSEQELLLAMAKHACWRMGVAWHDFVQKARQIPQEKRQPNPIWEALLQSQAGLAASIQTNPTAAQTRTADLAHEVLRQDYQAQYLQHPRLLEIARHLLQKGRLPRWLACPQYMSPSRLLFDMLENCPQRLAQLLTSLQSDRAAWLRILQYLPLPQLLAALRHSEPQQQSKLAALQELQAWLHALEIPHTTASLRDTRLLDLILQHWLANDWMGLRAEKIVMRFFYQLLQQQLISNAELGKLLALPQFELAPHWQAALRPLLHKPVARAASSQQPHKNSGAVSKLSAHDQLQGTPLPINNAGLVILQNFFTPLLTRLGLLVDDKFIDPQAQRRAVHCLQFIASGKSNTEEHHLMLNKLLCGMNLATPIEAEITMSEKEKKICNGLIDAAIKYWPAIGESSINGFRGNWLLRDGLLSEQTDHWALVVEKRAYDVLMQRAPFSYTVIKLPWMDKAIYVTWPT